MIETETLPIQIVMAIQADRGELCFAYAKSIRAKNELAAALAQVIGELLNDRRAVRNCAVHRRDDENRDSLETAMLIAREQVP